MVPADTVGRDEGLTRRYLDSLEPGLSPALELTWKFTVFIFACGDDVVLALWWTIAGTGLKGALHFVAGIL